MSATAHTDPLTLVSARTFLHGVSEEFVRRFRGGRNGRVGPRGRVHAVIPATFLGVDVMVPACRVGVSGWDFGRLHETSDEISCRRPACRNHVVARASTPATPEPGDQAVLFQLSA
jgi:hypothetical protein